MRHLIAMFMLTALTAQADTPRLTPALQKLEDARRSGPWPKWISCSAATMNCLVDGNGGLLLKRFDRDGKEDTALPERVFNECAEPEDCPSSFTVTIDRRGKVDHVEVGPPFTPPCDP